MEKMKIKNKTKDHAVKDWLLLVYFIGTKRLELFAQYLSDILYNHKFLDKFILNIYCMNTKNRNIFTLATYFMQQS